ncbi:TetR/AcrR family transcriptional regulator [Rhizobium rhizogenes]|uniref:TetR/AcrR family transcriptional regulator n=1 Tax=Rhizobium rhizogenes TaxID=359 RepID=UPI00157342F4|nr:TetR/AcrR family transcriptional regulator [Rhizobium rhizogenes]NTI78710.1 TetR/AcrR family transcriptional regulator [Rhizobium rhizogenes]
MIDKQDKHTSLSAPGRIRRTQAERSQETRLRVCIATIEALCEVGYEKISTPLIAEKANISRGALTHQFPTRNDLLVAAYQHLIGGWENDFLFSNGLKLVRLEIDVLIDVFWDKIFATRHYIAAMELMLAARLDNDLGVALREVLRAWIRRRDSIALEIIGASKDDDNARLFIQLNLSVLRGIALHQSVDDDSISSQRLLELWKSIARGVQRDRIGVEGRPAVKGESPFSLQYRPER